MNMILFMRCCVGAAILGFAAPAQAACPPAGKGVMADVTNIDAVKGFVLVTLTTVRGKTVTFRWPARDTAAVGTFSVAAEVGLPLRISGDARQPWFVEEWTPGKPHCVSIPLK